MRIRDIATIPAVTCPPSATVTQVARTMMETDVGCVVVVDDDGRPVGICTDRDLVVRAVAGDWPAQTPVHAVMSHDVVSLPGDVDILRAGELMGSWSYRRLPILDDAGRVEGLLSLDDLAVLFATEVDRVVRVIRTERRAHVPNEPFTPGSRLPAR